MQFLVPCIRTPSAHSYIPTTQIRSDRRFEQRSDSESLKFVPQNHPETHYESALIKLTSEQFLDTICTNRFLTIWDQQHLNRTASAYYPHSENHRTQITVLYHLHSNSDSTQICSTNHPATFKLTSLLFDANFTIRSLTVWDSIWTEYHDILYTLPES
jgi:hypothetical protein